MKSDYNLEGEIAEINMTPFVDIVLVLLIVFMATASFITQSAIEVNLPHASSSEELNEKDKKLVITIDKSENIFLNGKEISQEQMLATLTTFNKKTPVVIRSDEKVDYGKVIKIIDLCKENGFLRYALESQKTSS